MSEIDPQRLQARLQALFLEELQDNLRVLTRGLAQLEVRAGEEVDGRTVQELFRAAHSLKGAAHAAGITQAIEPCRRLEHFLAELHAGPALADDDVLRTFAADLATLAELERSLAAGGTPAAADPDADGRAGGWAGVQAAGGAREVRARVAVDVLDAFVHQAGALLSTTQALQLVTATLIATGDATAAAAGEAIDLGRKLAGAAAQIAETAQRLRLQPIGDVTAGLEHALREVSRATGKQARLLLEGGGVELDRDVGDAIREPLLHLVRNAVDHGLEVPGTRAAAGKSPIGTVRVGATATAGRVRVTVADDGAGIDVDGLRAAAGLTSGSAEAELELAFLPGLSTAPAVNDVSGRGVGLDAVRGHVEALGGTVELRSGTGTGTEVTLDVPMTLALLRVTVAAVDGELVTLPAASVQRVRRIVPDEARTLDGTLRVVLDGVAVAAIPLGAALGFPTDPTRTRPGIVIELVGEQRVLLVDWVEGELDGLLRRLPPRARSSGTVSGAIVLPSGRVALVVNPPACLRAGAALTAVPASRGPVRTQPTVLLAEDTFTTRALEHSVLAGAGYDVVDASDGAEAWRLLTERHVDLVVSDVDMPRMGGIELCRAIRAAPRFKDIPVVLVTSLETDADVRRGVEAGANAYLVKSAFDQSTLLDTVSRLL